MNEREQYESLKDNPPLPPWKANPAWDRHSIGWRMGGEEHLFKLYLFFKYAPPEVIASYRQQHPEPPAWKGWYEDE